MHSLRNRVLAESIIETLLTGIIGISLLLAALNTGDQKLTRGEIAAGIAMLAFLIAFLSLCGFLIARMRLARVDREEWSVDEDVATRRSLVGDKSDVVIRLHEVLQWHCRRDLPLVGKIWRVRLVVAPDDANGHYVERPFWIRGMKMKNYRFFPVYPLDAAGKNGLVNKLKRRSGAKKDAPAKARLHKSGGGGN